MKVYRRLEKVSSRAFFRGFPAVPSFAEEGDQATSDGSTPNPKSNCARRCLDRAHRTSKPSEGGMTVGKLALAASLGLTFLFSTATIALAEPPGTEDPNNWPQYNRTTNAWRYSPLDQI